MSHEALMAAQEARAATENVGAVVKTIDARLEMLRAQMDAGRPEGAQELLEGLGAFMFARDLARARAAVALKRAERLHFAERMQQGDALT